MFWNSKKIKELEERIYLIEQEINAMNYRDKEESVLFKQWQQLGIFIITSIRITAEDHPNQNNLKYHRIIYEAFNTETTKIHTFTQKQLKKYIEENQILNNSITNDDN